jgi:DNA invertase Pin-like site-specific DNA recombinase
MKGGAMKAAAIYARVSTSGQTTDNQVRELRKVAKRHGWKIAAEFIGHGVSGAKGRAKRPALDKLLKAANRRDFSIIMAWSVDRLGRSLQHLVGFLDEIHAKGVDLYLHQQNIDTGTPSGKAMFQMAGVFAEFERSMIQERVRAGLERAREHGKVLGRPKVSPRTEVLIRKKRKQGMGIIKIAKEVGVGASVFQRVLKAA